MQEMRSRYLLESVKESEKWGGKRRGWKMKVRKKRSRVEGVLAYVPFQAIENLVIDASDITPGDLPAARRVSGISSGAVHMTLPATSGSF